MVTFAPTTVPLTAAALAAFAACAGPSGARGGDPGGGTGDDGISNPQGTEMQAVGRALEGFVAPSTGWTLRGKPLPAVRVVEGELVVRDRRGPGTGSGTHRHDKGHGNDLRGAVFTATTADGVAVAMRIIADPPRRHLAAGPRPTRRQREYVIEVQADGATWTSLCAEGGAVPIAGSFGVSDLRVGGQGRAVHHPTGDYRAVPEQITFACADGVASKCIDWGYWPWKVPSLYQACTRMARADYCGTGRSHTVDGTMVNYGDLQARPIARYVHMDGFALEAVWGPGTGATGEAAVRCLSRTRWSTIPLGPRSPCADLMPDPREMIAAATAGKERFCDDMTVADWATEGALFVSSSQPLDTGLARWTDDRGHYITTSRNPWLGRDVEASPPTGFSTFVDIEGAAYRPIEAASKSRADLIPLYSYRRVADGAAQALTTTDGSPGDGYGEQDLEAYIHAPAAEPPVDGARQLFLHRHQREPGVYATTAEPTPPADYVLDRALGWLPH